MDITNILNEYKFRTELHAHTSPVSRCGKISPEEMVERYSEAGADCVVVTNHLNPDWLAKSADTRVEEYLSDYYRAFETGKRFGVHVILGVEVRFCENDNDYLVYGVEPSDIEKIISYIDKGISEFYRGFKNDKNIILQAHPFRKNMVLAPLDSIDGVETFNCHPVHNSKVAVAARYARDNRLTVSGGTDYHDPGDHGLCMMRSKKKPETSYDIAEILKSHDYLFDIAGSIVFPYGY